MPRETVSRYAKQLLALKKARDVKKKKRLARERNLKKARAVRRRKRR